MTLTLQSVDHGIFTIADVFTPAECSDSIERSESIGFDAASVRTERGPKIMTNIRNNDRVNITDPELAVLMWNRVVDLLPEIDGQHPVSVDSRLRFYRYLPGQQFRRHKDGHATDDLGNDSQLSYLIYLNDDFEGGATAFRDYVGSGNDRRKIEHVINPTTGSALLFRHALWHEGVLVQSGRKYVLRSDVFYSSSHTGG